MSYPISHSGKSMVPIQTIALSRKLLIGWETITKRVTYAVLGLFAAVSFVVPLMVGKGLLFALVCAIAGVGIGAAVTGSAISLGIIAIVIACWISRAVKVSHRLYQEHILHKQPLVDRQMLIENFKDVYKDLVASAVKQGNKLRPPVLQKISEYYADIVLDRPYSPLTFADVKHERLELIQRLQDDYLLESLRDDEFEFAIYAFDQLAQEWLLARKLEGYIENANFTDEGIDPHAAFQAAQVICTVFNNAYQKINSQRLQIMLKKDIDAVLIDVHIAFESCLQDRLEDGSLSQKQVELAQLAFTKCFLNANSL